MIKAIILVQLWSVIVAAITWFLQRDKGQDFGENFPAPKVWLTLIALCVLPGVLYYAPFDMPINLPDIEAIQVLPVPVNEASVESFEFLNYLAVYMGFSLLFIGRTLWKWMRLQGLALDATAEPDVFTTSEKLPPLTLSWPHRAIVVPLGLEDQAALIRHERAHLKHNDPEITLLLLLLQDTLLRNPGITYLVRQWRLSIELRADYAAIEMQTPAERKDYAALLLSMQRPTGRNVEELPCPTARINSTRHRVVKMRLTEILETKPKARKTRWSAALISTAICATAIGLMSSAASAKYGVINAGFDQVGYVKQSFVKPPASCFGLIKNNAKLEEKKLMVNGQLAVQKTINLGTVVLSHDVRRDGTIFNPAIINSSHRCFEADAKAALLNWKAEPQDYETKNVAVKVHFIVSASTVDELKRQLDGFYK